VSFASPGVLLGLLALPALAVWYVIEQRRRERGARAFVAAPLTASVAPNRPGSKKHLPYALLVLALAVLIIAAAHPQHSVVVPVKGATVMLVNDVSDSMTATDVKPSRLGAARKAALAFLRGAPSSIKVGSIEFAREPILLESPTGEHRLTAAAIQQLAPKGGGTAIGEAIEAALTAIQTAPKIDGKHPPGAIVLLSDGTSNVGIGPIEAARQAKQEHVRIYTIAIGTASGTMTSVERGRAIKVPVPVSPQELRQTAAASGGRSFTAADATRASAIYAHLARTLGRKHANQALTAGVAGGGLVLLLAGGALSLWWFGRLI
jgi:Ca-activated chloride channel family protein